MNDRRQEAIAELRTVQGIGKSTAPVLFDKYAIDSLHKLTAVLKDERSVDKLVNDPDIRASEATVRGWLSQLEKGENMSEESLDEQLKAQAAEAEAAKAEAAEAEAAKAEAAEAEAAKAQAAEAEAAKAAEAAEAAEAEADYYTVQEGKCVVLNGRSYEAGAEIPKGLLVSSPEKLIAKGILK